jgi:hypothetical protein
MMYLCVIFISPVYFMIRKKWGAFTLNAILYGLAWVFLISILGAWIAPFFWMLAVGHAGWHLRKEIVAEAAEVLATKMVEKLGQQSSPPALPSSEAVKPASFLARSDVAPQLPGSARGSYCPNCGAAALPDSKFCSDCGAALT